MILAIWSALTLFCFLLMLLHQSDEGVFFGRYSASYLLQLGVMAFFFAVSIVILLLTNRKKIALISKTPVGAGHASPLQNQHLPNLSRFLPQKYGLFFILMLGIAALIAIWLFLPGGRGQPAVALFSVYLLLTGSGILLWLARQTPLILPQYSDVILVLLGIGITLLLSLRYVGHIPASLLYDEPWVTNWSVALWQTGTPQVPMYPLLNAERALAGSSWFVALGAWLDIFGISLVNARWFWWLLGMMSVPFLALAANRVYGRTGAVLAALLGLGLFLPHNYGRWDVGVLLALAIALYALVSGWQSGRWQWYIVAGGATALSLEGHFISLRWIVALGALIAWEYLQQMRQKRRWLFYAPFWAFLAGGIIGSLLFLFWHTLAWGIAPLNWWAELTQAYTAETGLATTYGSGLERIGNMAQAWMLQTLIDYPLETGLLILGLLAWIFRGDAFERRWLTMFILGTLILLVLQPKTSPFYAVHHLPFTVLAGTGLLVKISGAVHTRRTLAWGVSVMLVISLSTTHILWLVRSNTQNADQTIASGYTIQALLPPEIERIAARQPFYYGLSAREFVNIELFHNLNWQEWENQIGLLPPQAVIVVRGWDDVYPAVLDYIAAAKMVKIACVPLDIYGGAADVYVLPVFGLINTGTC
jgi:hypothetical protein